MLLILSGPYLITFSDKNFDLHGKYDLMLMPSLDLLGEAKLGVGFKIRLNSPWKSKFLPENEMKWEGVKFWFH